MIFPINSRKEKKIKETPFQVAARTGNLEILKYLFESGANIDEKDCISSLSIMNQNLKRKMMKWNETALMKARDHKKKEIIRFLRKNKAHDDEESD